MQWFFQGGTRCKGCQLLVFGHRRGIFHSSARKVVGRIDFTIFRRRLVGRRRGTVLLLGNHHHGGSSTDGSPHNPLSVVALHDVGIFNDFVDWILEGPLVSYCITSVVRSDYFLTFI